MEIKDFERYLELVKIKEEYGNAYSESKNEDDFQLYLKVGSELSKLKDNILKFIFENQSNMETTVDKLKLTLNKIGLSEYGYGSYSDPNKSFNEIKMVKEILNLLEMYDWKLMYSNYGTTDNEGNWIKQVAVWEQNGEGLIRKHKVWNVVEALDAVGKSTKDTGKEIYEALMSLPDKIENKERLDKILAIAQDELDKIASAETITT